MAASSVSAIPQWDSLPTEMKFSVVAHLDPNDVRTFSKVNKEAYTIALPTMWKVRPACLLHVTPTTMLTT